MTDELTPEQKEAQARAAQMEAWKHFAQANPIAARKARQRAEEEQRRHFAVNLHFGKITMEARHD